MDKNFSTNEFYLSLDDIEKEYFLKCIHDAKHTENGLENEYKKLKELGESLYMTFNNNDQKYVSLIARISSQIKVFCDNCVSPALHDTTWSHSPNDSDKKIILKLYYKHVEAIGKLISEVSDTISFLSCLTERCEEYELQKQDAEYREHIFCIATGTDKKTRVLPCPTEIIKNIAEISTNAYKYEKQIGIYLTELDAALDAPNKGRKMNLSEVKDLCIKTFLIFSGM